MSRSNQHGRVVLHGSGTLCYMLRGLCPRLSHDSAWRQAPRVRSPRRNVRLSERIFSSETARHDIESPCYSARARSALNMHLAAIDWHNLFWVVGILAGAIIIALVVH